MMSSFPSIIRPRPSRTGSAGPETGVSSMNKPARCRGLGVSVTLIAVMMRSNFDRLAEIAEGARASDAPLRINVYQSVRSDAFALTYDEYWRGFEALFAGTDAIAIGEPLVRAMAGLPPRRGGCGVATVRVTPRATVQPCVYWPGGGAPLDLLLERRARICRTGAFAAARGVPSACRNCSYVATCGGGCAGRRPRKDPARTRQRARSPTLSIPTHCQPFAGNRRRCHDLLTLAEILFISFHPAGIARLCS